MKWGQDTGSGAEPQPGGRAGWGRWYISSAYQCLHLLVYKKLPAGVPRHQGRIIYLTYSPPGEVTKSLFLVGKGVTYDTGGADIKAGGVMAGMHR